MTKPAPEAIRRIIRAALDEDIGTGDITTLLLVPQALRAEMQLNARVPLVMAGGEVVAQVFAALSPAVNVVQRVPDGAQAEAGSVIVTVSGPASVLLTGERVALNLLQRMCGVATLTRRYVDAVAGTKAKILDTRKTMPGLRALDKYAVTCGGGVNHRFGLYDAVLVKDNHLGIRQRALGIRELVEEVREKLPSLMPNAYGQLPAIIVECDTLEQVRDVLKAKPDRILLDNMPPDMLREAVALSAGSVLLEASGGITLDNVRSVAETGVDYISIGALTHSAPSVDIGADVVMG